MLTNFWDKGDCQFCHSAFTVVGVKSLRKQVCEKCGRDTDGRLIEKGLPPKTRKAYLGPSAANDLKILKTSQREFWARKYGNFKIRIPSEPKRKALKISQCPGCPEYAKCQELCPKASRYVNQDQVVGYAVLAATVPEIEGSLGLFLRDPQNTPNLEIDNIHLYSADHEEGLHNVISGSFDDPKVGEVYKADLLDGYKKIEIMRARTPVWAWKQPAPVGVLYMFFKMRLRVREIARRLDLSPGRVSRIVKQHRVVLQNHLVSVLLDDRSRSYFYEKYFNQQTNAQIAEKYRVSHQAVSKSIRRTGKIIVKSLRFSVAFSQSISGGLLFFQDGNNLVLTQQKKVVILP